MTLQEDFAVFIKECNYEDFPHNVINKVKYCILDYLGCALVGSQTSLAEKYYYLGKRLGEKPNSIMIGDGGLVSPIWASMTNGTIGHIHEYDDSCPGGGHTGTVVIPAALAAGNCANISGKQLISSIILGYETACRIGSSVGKSHRDRGYHSTSTFATFGAAAAAGKALNLNKDMLSRALGIASIYATGILEVHKGRSILKPAQVGKSSANGITSALMAKSGVPASLTILEKKFFDAFTDGDYNLDSINTKLDDTYAILKTYFKPYPACAHTHKAIKAMIELKRKYKFTARDVDEVIVRSYTYAAEHMGGSDRYDPPTITGAKFSIPYLISLVIDHDKINIDDFTNNKIFNSDIKKLISKVVVIGDSELDKSNNRPQEVIVKLNNGQKYSEYIEKVNLSHDEVEKKYTSLAERTMPREDMMLLKESVLNIESLEDINLINRYLITDRFSLPSLQ